MRARPSPGSRERETIARRRASAAPESAGHIALQLQRTIGNAAVTRVLQRAAGVQRQPTPGTAAKSKKYAAGAPASFAAANERHKANLSLLNNMLNTGKSEKDSKWGKSWPNACQWLLAGKTTLHALTETHDSLARATTLGDASLRAFFGISAVVPTVSTYDENDQTKAANVDLVNPTWLGFRQAGSPSKVVIIDPVTKSRSLVQETIVHEVQHDADHHGGADFERYQTEFDAYWIDKTFGDVSSRHGSADDTMAAADGTVMSGFDNARQQRIFIHLYDSTSYPYVATGWGVAAFKAKVLALRFPTGTNLVNSVRIDDLYLELTKAPPDVAGAKKKLKLLTGHDQAAIASPAMIGAWRTLIATLSDPADRTYFTTRLGL